MKKLYTLLFAFCILGFVNAQQPVPAPVQKKPILILNGRAHLGDGTVIEKSVLAFDNGKITKVGQADNHGLSVSEYEVIEASGKDIYPGFIATNTVLGLNEVELVRATNDYSEVGAINPNVRAIISYNTDSKVIPTVRSNGILMAQIVPVGGTVSGTSSVVQLDAWNWEDAVYLNDGGVHLNWPRMHVQRRSSAKSEEEQRANTEKEIMLVRTFFNEAKAYAESKPTETNLRLAALSGLFNGNKKLFIHCGSVNEIMSSVTFAKDLRLNAVLVGAEEAWMITEFLKENNASILLARTHSLPSKEDEDIDMPYKLPSILQKAGIPFALSVDGFWQVRNLPFIAGTAVAYGLSKEEALMSITSSAAKILGIDKTVGTLEVGKDATLFISNGDALDMRTNLVEKAFIQGRSIDVRNIQTELYGKYKTKYGLK